MQISFQEFKNKLLEPGLVDHIEVSNKAVAKVYVKNVPHPISQDENIDVDTEIHPNASRSNGSQYKFYFNIGSVDSFERKLEESQEDLGIDPHDYVPVTYISELSWLQEVLSLIPTALVIGTLVYLNRKALGGSGLGGGGGSRSIFSVGKAHVSKLDKNSLYELKGTTIGIS